MKARKTHYYVSTHQIPGVYNSPFFPPQPSAKEIELRNARPLSLRSRRKLRSQLQSDAAEILNQSQSVKMVTRESKSVPLPPISMKSTAKVQVRNDNNIIVFESTHYLLQNVKQQRAYIDRTAQMLSFVWS